MFLVRVWNSSLADMVMLAKNTRRPSWLPHTAGYRNVLPRPSLKPQSTFVTNSSAIRVTGGTAGNLRFRTIISGGN